MQQRTEYSIEDAPYCCICEKFLGNGDFYVTQYTFDEIELYFCSEHAWIRDLRETWDD